MIGAAIRTRMRARPVGDGRRLAYGGYAYLEYSPCAPYEVRLVQPGPYPIEVMFARDILASALTGEPDGHGEVRARLEYVPAARHSMVLITVDLPDELPPEVQLLLILVRNWSDTSQATPRAWQSTQYRDMALDFIPANCQVISSFLAGAAFFRH